MSVTRQVTKYRCDGCGFESEAPHEWRSFNLVGSGIISVGSFCASEDYCPTCVSTMRSAVRRG